MMTTDYLLSYLQNNKYNTRDPNNVLIVSFLASSFSVYRELINTYGLSYLYKFSPTRLTCERLLKLLCCTEDILFCCVMYKYNSLYFEHASHVFSYRLYEIAAKTNNKDIYNHQLSLSRDKGLKMLPIEFDYSLYIN